MDTARVRDFKVSEFDGDIELSCGESPCVTFALTCANWCMHRVRISDNVPVIAAVSVCGACDFNKRETARLGESPVAR